MAYIIIFILIIVVALTLSGKKKANEELENLFDVLNTFNDKEIIEFGSLYLHIFLPDDRKSVYDKLKNGWHLMTIDRKKLTTLHALVMKAKKDGDSNRLNFLENERITLMMKMNVIS